MTFSAPWMLLGLLALLIPVALHLKYRESRAVQFPGIELLHKIMDKNRSRIKLRRILLLLLRMLTLGLIFMAVARPSLDVERQTGIRGGPPVALAIIIDDSMSMGLQDTSQTSLLERAVELAQTELDRLRPGDGATLILGGAPARPTTKSVGFDLDVVKDEFPAIKPTHRSGDLQNAILEAIGILRRANQQSKEIVLITDLSDSASADFLSSFNETDVMLRVVDPGPDVARTNLFVANVAVRSAAESSPKEVKIEAQITNLSSETAVIAAILVIDGTEATRGTIEIPAQSTASKIFHHRFNENGIHTGHVLIEHDNLDFDDIRHFAVNIDQSIRALLINGDYRPGSYQDETFYLLRALETPVGGTVPIRPTVLDVETAGKVPFKGSDVIFLAGVTEISQNLAARLQQYVLDGGGLFVSPGSADQEALGSIEELLPGPPRSVRRSYNNRKRIKISKFDNSHPLFQSFSNKPTGLEDTRIDAHLLVEPNPTVDKRVLINLNGGLPLLFERRIGKGRVLFLTTTIDRDWSDLPIRPGYLPLVQRSARLLAGKLDDRGVKYIEIGQPVIIEVSKGMQRLIVRRPDGSDLVFSAIDLADKAAIEIADTFQPGYYRVWTDIPQYGGLREIGGLGFVVQSAPEESDLNPTTAPSALAPKDTQSSKGKLPLWPYFLLAACLVFMTEAIVSGLVPRRRPTISDTDFS